MKITVYLILLCASVAYGCIGFGCIHDRMENRFYWISSRAKSEISSVIEQGGPSSYCNSLGLAITSPGSTLWNRGLELYRIASENEARFIQTEVDKSVDKSVEEETRDPDTLWPNRVICHEQKWD